MRLLRTAGRWTTSLPGSRRLRPSAVTREELGRRLAERDDLPLAVRGGKLRISVVQYPSIDHHPAMAWGDAFTLHEVGAFQLADFAQRCDVDKRLLQREVTRLAKLVRQHALEQALAGDYVDDEERAFAGQLRDLVVAQATRLSKLAGQAVKVKDDLL
jgi:hypothetical protein